MYFITSQKRSVGLCVGDLCIAAGVCVKTSQVTLKRDESEGVSRVLDPSLLKNTLDTRRVVKNIARCAACTLSDIFYYPTK